jgi:outer membrane biosynthesis protein TonB
MAKAGFLAGMVFLVIVPAFSSRSRRGAAYVAVWVAEAFLMGLALRFAQGEPSARDYLAQPVHLAWVTLAALGAWTAMGISATLVLRRLAGGYAWAPPTAGAAGILLFLAALFLGGAPAPPAPAAAAPTATAATRQPAEAPSERAVSPESPVPSAPPQKAPDSITATPVSKTAPEAVSLPSSVIAATAPPLPNVTPPKKEAAESAGPKDTAAESTPTAAEIDPPEQAGQAETRPSGATVELRGVMQKEGALPKFRIVLNAAGGRNRTMDIVLGETVYGPWKAFEYNTTSKKLTLSNAERMVVVDTGERIDLPE